MHNKAPLKSAQLFRIVVVVVVPGVVAFAAVAVAAVADAAFGNFAICMPSCRHFHTNRRQSGLHMGPEPGQPT